MLLSRISNHHFYLLIIIWLLPNLNAAMLAYKTVSGTKSFKKSVHLTLQFLAFFLSLIGVWAAIKFHNDKGIDNFYSLHSWLGVLCLFLFSIQVFSQFLTFSFILVSCILFRSALGKVGKFLYFKLSDIMHIFSFVQWAAGFATFWYPGGSRNSRSSLLPWHVFFGVYIYALAVATCATGILEKATFLQTNNIISRYSSEALLVNSLGVLLIALGGFVVLAIISPGNGKGEILRGSTE